MAELFDVTESFNRALEQSGFQEPRIVSRVIDRIPRAGLFGFAVAFGVAGAAMIGRMTLKKAG